MMTVEIKINGTVIGLLQIVNTSDQNKKLEYIYDVEAYLPADDGSRGKIVTCMVAHDRGEGAVALVRKSLNQIWYNTKKE